MTGLFVTATGTDVGKTFVTAGLLRALRRRGIASQAIKPVLSGFDENDAAGWSTSDAGVLLAAMERDVTLDSIAAMTPFRFQAPLSPDMAAAREHRSLDFDAVTAFATAAVTGFSGVTLVEGVGGALVPLDDTRTVADWNRAMDIPAIVVTRGALGMLSHTLSVVESLRCRGVTIAAIVINAGVDDVECRLDAPRAPTTTETVETLARHLLASGGAAPVAVLPPTPTDAAFDALATTLFSPG